MTNINIGKVAHTKCKNNELDWGIRTFVIKTHKYVGFISMGSWAQIDQ